MKVVLIIAVSVLVGGVSAAAVEPTRTFTSPTSTTPEYGHGLTAGEPNQGWVSLFDGQTDFGWAGGRVTASGAAATLAGGTTTSPFGDLELRVDTPTGGELLVGARKTPVRVPAGISKHKVEGRGVGPIRLGQGLSVSTLLVRPLGLKPAFAADSPGTPDQAARVIPHPSLPTARQAKWEALPDLARGGKTVSGMHAVGGPGCAELPGEYGDFVLQLTLRVRNPMSNAGVFFRSKRGEFLEGYEAQVFNGCYDGDPAQPARYATGAIDDRQNARRLVSRDGEPFAMTIVAAGPHVATWVNGLQVTDWTDDRKPDDNPRKGLRLRPGPIQLQAHDRNTDVEFHTIRIRALDTH